MSVWTSPNNNNTLNSQLLASAKGKPAAPPPRTLSGGRRAAGSQELWRAAFRRSGHNTFPSSLDGGKTVTRSLHLSDHSFLCHHFYYHLFFTESSQGAAVVVTWAICYSGPPASSRPRQAVSSPSRFLFHTSCFPCMHFLCIYFPLVIVQSLPFITCQFSIKENILGRVSFFTFACFIFGQVIFCLKITFHFFFPSQIGNTYSASRLYHISCLLSTVLFWRLRFRHSRSPHPPGLPADPPPLGGGIFTPCALLHRKRKRTKGK